MEEKKDKKHRGITSKISDLPQLMRQKIEKTKYARVIQSSHLNIMLIKIWINYILHGVKILEN